MVQEWLYEEPGPYPIGDLDKSDSSLADIAADCQEICKKWVEGCRAAADAGKRCLDGFAEGKKKFYKDGECKSLENPYDLKDCQLYYDYEFKSFQNFSNCEASGPKTCCQDMLPICVDQCVNYGPGAEWQYKLPESCQSLVCNIYN